METFANIDLHCDRVSDKTYRLEQADAAMLTETTLEGTESEADEGRCRWWPYIARKH